MVVRSVKRPEPEACTARPDVQIKHEGGAPRKTAKGAVSVVGLGYVGFPLASLCAERGYLTYGIDTNLRRVAQINSEHDSPNPEMKTGKPARIEATADFASVRNTDTIVVCVPTPLDGEQRPDFGPLSSACEAIAANLRKGHLVIIESTISPGGCEGIVQPVLEHSGLKAGRDFDIAHCPERIDPGNQKWSVRNIPRVLGASSARGLEKALAFYRSILEAEVMPLSSIRVAEATKVVENSFRDLNIAFVNELAKSFSKIGLDVTEVIRAAGTKPYAFMPHYPGCGVGGDCIPVSPWYLIRWGEQNGADHRLMRMAREINDSMPEYTVGLLLSELSRPEFSAEKPSVGVLGLSHKADVADTRLSPARKIIDLLKTAGLNVQTYDPYLKEASTAKSLDELLRTSKVLVLATAHREFVNMDPEKLRENGTRIVIDGRNSLDMERIQGLGIIYRGIGK